MKLFDKKGIKRKKYTLTFTPKTRRKYLFPITASAVSLLVAVGGLALFFNFHGFKGQASEPQKISSAQSVSKMPLANEVSKTSSSEKSSQSSSSKEETATNPKSTKVNANGYFDDAVFVGDSLTCDINMIDCIGNPTIVGSSGVSVYRALNDHKCIINEKKKDVAYMPDRVLAAHPKKIYMMFGLNDLCWGEQMTESMFIKNYSKLIDIFKEGCPDAKIYVQSIMPITEKMENSKQTPFTNKRIETFNNDLKKLSSEKGAAYLDVASIVRTSDGKLQKGVSDDGIHLHADKYKLWMNYLLSNK